MFGAVGTPDESLEIIACATYSGSSKVPTYLNRMYRSSTTVTFDSCAVYSRLCGGIEATTQGSGAIILTGSSPSAIGLLKTYTGANVRSSSDNSHGIFLTSATNAIVSSCYVSGASGAGILSRGCSNVSVYGNTVRDTLADGIHFTVGTTKFIDSPPVTIAVSSASQIKIREYADLTNTGINHIISEVTQKYCNYTKWNQNFSYSKNDLISFVKLFKEDSKILESLIN